MGSILKEETKDGMPYYIRLGLDVFAYYGFPALAAIALFLVVFGFIPSPLMQNQEILKKNQLLIQLHQNESQVAAGKQIKLALAQCVNAAMMKSDIMAARICLASVERTEAGQRHLIREMLNNTKP